ncbi:HutD family protein [Nocardioides sp. NPDC101246]|uniref:HutD/Ves family protein n=1 Tax=Nocardioides sp. NPDC101246 TaxID=3364336 RepID=UPI00380735B1
MSGPAHVLIDSGDVAPVPWRNGLGRTRELLVGPGWRLSLADLTAPGPFSSFPGNDRVHLPLEDGYTLVVDGHPIQARALQSVGFPGEAPVVLQDLARPTSALNLITERATCTGALVVARHEGTLTWPAYVRAVVLLDRPAPLVVAGDEPLTLHLTGGPVAEVHIFEPKEHQS